MKLRTSFFNKTVFKKNITLYWPLWSVYTLVLLVMQPLMLWAEYYTDPFGVREELIGLRYVLEMEMYVMPFMAASVLFGMALFSYLYSSKSANMMHALPVDRKQLFGTNVISGLCFLMVPQVLVASMSTLISLIYGVREIYYIGSWLLASMAMVFILFSVVTFCAMFTGLLVALPVFFGIVNGLSYWVYALFYCVSAAFGYGVTRVDERYHELARILSPLDCMGSYVAFEGNYSKNGELIGMQLIGIPHLLVYLVVAVILLICAYKVYEKRHIESAGDLITVRWVKPIFRWGAGISGGIFGGILVRLFLQDISIKVPLAIFLMVMVLLGGLAYFLSDMLVKKNFRVFQKKNWAHCGLFTITLLVCFFGLWQIAKYQENYIPDEEDIRNVRVYMGYEMLLYGENISDICEIHQSIIDHADREATYMSNSQNVSIQYVLKNGEIVYREYDIAIDDPEMENVLNKLALMETDVETFLYSQMGENYEHSDGFIYGWLNFALINADGEDEYGELYEYMDKQLSDEQMKVLYQAIIADTKEGSLIKYNTYSTLAGSVYSEARLAMEYLFTEYESGEPIDSYYTVNISFGPDCKNIVNALIDFGYFDSVEQVYWGE